MLERIVPPDENELANKILISYEDDSKRLAAMKEETQMLMDDLENVYYINPEIKEQINILLDKQDTINMELEDNVDALKNRLEDMGVSV